MIKSEKSEFFNNSFTKHHIEYFIINNETHDDIYLRDIYIDPDDGKTFASLLVSFCKMASDNKIKHIKLTISDEEYKSNKQLFREFDVTDIEDGLHSLTSEPSKFAEAMLVSYGCFDCDDKIEKLTV